MARGGSFWRNAALIGAAHVAIIAGIARWSSQAPKRQPDGIMWIGAQAEPAPPPPAAFAPVVALTTPPVADTDADDERQQNEPPEQPTISAAKSDIPVTRPPPVKAKATATAKPRATPGLQPTAKPKSTAKPTVLAKALARHSAPPKAAAEEKPSSAVGAVRVAPATGASGSAGSSAPGAAAQLASYGKMLHDRLYREWVQPTGLPAGARYTLPVKLRIERDGRVSEFTLVGSSGNVVVDESVAAAGKRLTQVDPLPRELSAAGHYDLKVNFELDAE